MRSTLPRFAHDLPTDTWFAAAPVIAQTSSRRRWLVWLFRILVLLLVCLGVSGTVRSALAQLSQHDWQVSPVWLFVSGLLYAAGLVPMAWFWHRSLASLGQPTPWPATLRAYFFGHLGKYVPGKALAVILRVTAVSKWVTSLRVAIVSSFLETLTMMAVGAFLAAALSIVVLRSEPRLAAIAAALAVLVGLPTLPPIARRLAQLGIRRLPADEGPAASSQPRPADVDANLHGVTLRLLSTGWMAAGTCWLFLGLSLWATLRAIGIDRVDPVSDLPLLVAAATFSVVAGFASMLPGGLVVRDAVLMQLLAPVCGEADAFIAALLVRLVWLVSELAACVILYLGAKIR